MIFLVLSGKIIFLFPESMILFFRQKIWDDLSQKKYMEIWYFLQMFWKDGLSTKIALEWDLSCIIWKDNILFTRKYDIFSLDAKWKIIFLKKCMEIWYFLYTRINVTNMVLPFCQKNQRRSFPKKIHWQVIDFLEWHCRKSSNDFLFFYVDLHSRFHILLSSEKKKTRKLNIEGWNLTSSSIALVGDILEWRIVNTLYHLTLRSYI